MIISFDYHGSSEPQTGLVAPLCARPNDPPNLVVKNVDYSAKYWLANGMPRHKIVIGIPLFGRGWQLANATNHGVNAPTIAVSLQDKYLRYDGVACYYEVI